MKRKYNFSAGPATLPLEVLEQAQAELVDTGGEGLSILEMSHRSKRFGAILEGAKQSLAELLALPSDYEILFLQGGASQQFAMVPLNLGSGGAYVTTGTWSEKALAEARVVGEAAEIWSDVEGGFRKVPSRDEALSVPGDAPFLHITTNNTIYGTQWQHQPQSPVPVVADMSSDILSGPLGAKPYDLIYAGAQKNAGPAGVTLVIGRSALLRDFRGPSNTPKIFRYATHAKADSLYNTAPTFNIWLCALVFDWVREQGGVEEMARRAEAKAGRLYELIDGRPEVFRGHAAKEARSRMNVTFTLPSPEAERRFLAEAETAGCVGLAGHRSVGGIRASIYNALPMEGVEALAQIMERFQP